MATQGFAERISQIKDIGRDLQDDDVMGIGQEDSSKEIIPVNVPYSDLKKRVVDDIIRNPDMKDAFYATEAIIHDKVNDTVDINPKWTDEFMVRRDSLEISYVGDLNADFLPFSFDFKITTGTLTMFEDMPVLLDGQYYIVKKSSFPVHNMVMNSRRYLYLELRNGVPVIFISTQVLPETYIRTCFGFYYFSNDADPWVSEHQAFSYSRIGTYRVSPDPRGTSVPATYDSPARPAECWWLTKLYGPCAVNELETTLLIDKDFGGSRGELKEGFYIKGPYDLYAEYVRIKGRDPHPEEEVTFIVDKDVAVIGKPGYWPIDDPKSPIRSYPLRSIRWTVENGEVPAMYQFPAYGFCDNATQYDRNMRVLSYKLHRWADNISLDRQFHYKKNVLGFVYGQVALVGFFHWVKKLKIVIRILDANGWVLSTHTAVETSDRDGVVIRELYEIPYSGGIEMEVNYTSLNPNTTDGGLGVDVIAINANPNPAIVIPKEFGRAKRLELLVNGKVLGCGGDGGEFYNISTGRKSWRKNSSASGDIGILNFCRDTVFTLGNSDAVIHGGGSSDFPGSSLYTFRPAGATGNKHVPVPVAGGAPFGKGGICENEAGIPTITARNAGLLKGGTNNVYRSNTGGQGGNAGRWASQYLEQEISYDQWNNPTGVNYIKPYKMQSPPGSGIITTVPIKVVNPYHGRVPGMANMSDPNTRSNMMGLLNLGHGWDRDQPYTGTSKGIYITNQYGFVGTLEPGTVNTLRLTNTRQWLNSALAVVIPFGSNDLVTYAIFKNETNASSPGVWLEFRVSYDAKPGDKIIFRVRGRSFELEVWEEYQFVVK